MVMDAVRRPCRLTALTGLLLALAGSAAPAAAQVTLDFEGLPLNTAIAAPYGGFGSWGGMHAVAAAHGCNSSGATCATNFGATSTGLDRVMQFRPLVPFGFLSAQFTSWAVGTPPGLAFNTPFTMAVMGYRGSSQVFATMITVPSARARISFVWPNLTSLVFVPQQAAWFLMDDFTYVDGVTIPPEAVVPEPTTLVLLGSGLAGLGAAAVRRRRRGGTDPAA
jgi:hypothetical protein